MRPRLLPAVVAAFATVLALLPPRLAAQDRAQSRSTVSTTLGVVASESVLASQVAARILEAGGTAVDAAIAANAMMGLVAPMNDGIGGDLFAIVYEAKTGKLFGLNASGWAPRGLTPEFLRGQGLTRMPQRGIHAATVPGAVKGWEALHRRFGRLPMADILAPAIQHAELGFPVGEVVSVYWKDSEGVLREDAPTAATFLPGGRAPVAGELFRNPQLAWSYRQIATAGAKAFYTGAIAQQLVASARTHGGTLTAADLAEYDVEWVTPVSTTYRGWTVHELPPNGQGIAALQMLNILERYPLAEWGHNSARTLHAMIEAKKLAYADLQKHVGDPRFVTVPVAGLIGKGYADRQATRLSATRAACEVGGGDPGTPDNGTTYLAVADRAGNVVSLIQSNYSTVGFGAGLTVGTAGFVWHNRGGGFSLDAASPNVLAGRKRPLHTIIPAFMEKGDDKVAFGIMGGWNQSQAHAQFVANLVDFGMTLQGAMDAPRFSKETFAGCDVNLEARIPKAVRDSLAALGHEIVMRGDYSSTRMGAGQAVRHNVRTGLNSAASDPRKDGAAISELPAPARPLTPARPPRR